MRQSHSHTLKLQPQPKPMLLLQGILPPPFAEMQAQWATMGLDPNIMMAMMMYAAAASGASYCSSLITS